MRVSKCPPDFSSCRSNRHLKLNMSQSKHLIFPPQPASPHFSFLPPVSPLFLSCSHSPSGGLSSSKYIQIRPTCTSSVTYTVRANVFCWLILGQVLPFLLFSNPFPTQQSEGSFSRINQTPSLTLAKAFLATQVISAFFKQRQGSSCLLHAHSIFASLLTLP